MALVEQVHEELVGLVDDLGDAGVAAVGLVDDQDHRHVGVERLAQHEAGLGERALGGVDEQHDAVDHRQAALDLATEVGVAGGVDDVDDHRLAAAGGTGVVHRGVLREDRDALLALEVTGVHDPLGDALGLVGGEGAGLAQHGVDERGLAVVDVGDDRDVAEVGTCRHGSNVRFRVEAIGRRAGTPAPCAASESSALSRVTAIRRPRRLDASEPGPSPCRCRAGRPVHDSLGSPRLALHLHPALAARARGRRRRRSAAATQQLRATPRRRAPRSRDHRSAGRRRARPGPCTTPTTRRRSRAGRCAQPGSRRPATSPSTRRRPGSTATLAMFAEGFARDSYDGAGAPVSITVHYGQRLRQRLLGRHPAGLRRR